MHYESTTSETESDSGFALCDMSNIHMNSIYLDMHDYEEPLDGQTGGHTDTVITIESDEEEVLPTKKRFVVVTIASFVFFVQIFSQTIWNAVFEPAIMAFPNWSRSSLSLVPMWGSLLTAIFVFPACFTINKYGVKMILLGSCLVFTFGTAIRCLPLINASSLYVHISAIFLSMGNVVTTPLIITISAQWFPKTERNVATGFISAMGMMGSAAVYVAGPHFVRLEPDTYQDPYDIRHRIFYMLYLCFGFNLLVTILVLLCFPKHNSSVCHTLKLTLTTKKNVEILCSIKTLFTDINLWKIVLAFALANTVSAPWFGLLPSTFSQLNIPPMTSGRCSLFVIMFTFTLNIVISILADNYSKHRKKFAVISRFIALFFFIWLMLILNFNNKLYTCTLRYVVMAAFPFGWCSNGLMYQMGVKHMSSLPPSYVAGYMTLMNNLFVDVIYICLYFQPTLVKCCLSAGLVVFSMLSTVFLMLIPDQ